MTKLNKEYIFIVCMFFSNPLRIPRVDRVYTLEKSNNGCFVLFGLFFIRSSSVLKSDVQWLNFSPFQQQKSGSQSHAYGQTSDSRWEILKIANDR